MGDHRLERERMLSATPRTAAMLRGARLLLAVALVTAFVSVAFDAATHARRAGAICTGPGNPMTVYTYANGGTLVAEESLTYPGTTCNNDARYQGAVLDPVTDGSCAYAYYLEPLAYLGEQGSSCTTGVWSFYTYNDTIGANSVYVSVRPSYLPDTWNLSSGY